MTDYEKTLGELLAHVEGITPEFLEELSDLVDYVGFTPEATARVLVKYAAKNNRNLNEDLVFLTTLAVVRGTNIRKATKKMSKEGKAKVDALTTMYDLKTSSKGADAETLSLSRIVATFPQIAAMLIWKNTGINSRLGSLAPGLPDHLCFPGANALIPREGPMSDLHAEYEKFASAFSDLVKSKQTAEERKNFIEITKNSPVTSADDAREVFLRALS